MEHYVGIGSGLPPDVNLWIGSPALDGTEIQTATNNSDSLYSAVDKSGYYRKLHKAGEIIGDSALRNRLQQMGNGLAR